MSGDDADADGRVPIDATAVWPDDVDADEGVVANWFARAGRSVAAGETICEIQVEKVGADVPAPTAGTLDEIVVGEGEEFRRDQTLGWVRPE